jgi:hypothetical protein
VERSLADPELVEEFEGLLLELLIADSLAYDVTHRPAVEEGLRVRGW